MPKATYIVKGLAGFLTITGRFSPEYPDAELFTSPAKAGKAALAALRKNPEDMLDVIKGYGFDHEDTIATITA